MKRALLAVSAALVGLTLAAPGFALIGDGVTPVVTLHVKSKAAKASTVCTTENPKSTTCVDYSVTGDLNTAYDMYLVVAAAVDTPTVSFEAAGLSCGILYDRTDGVGVDIFQWTLCTDGLEFKNSPDGPGGPEWPVSGGGNRMTWTNCQVDTSGGLTDMSMQVTFGVFYVFAYSPDRFEITPNNNLGSGPELLISNCNAAVEPITYPPGFADFGGFGEGTGFNPCLGGVPVKQTTWGAVKSLYSN
jgi:hypothetical protein